MSKLRYLFPVCPAAAVVLACLPWGAVLRFGQPDGEPIRQTFSCFSLIPFGYANFWPLITAVLCCVLVILSLAAAIRPGKRLVRAVGNVAAVAAFCSVGSPVMLGTEYFTPIGGGMTALLAVQTILAIIFLRKSEV